MMGGSKGFKKNFLVKNLNLYSFQQQQKEKSETPENPYKAQAA